MKAKLSTLELEKSITESELRLADDSRELLKTHAKYDLGAIISEKNRLLRLGSEIKKMKAKHKRRKGKL